MCIRDSHWLIYLSSKEGDGNAWGFIKLLCSCGIEFHLIEWTRNLVPRVRFSFGQHQEHGLWPLPIYAQSQWRSVFVTVDNRCRFKFLSVRRRAGSPCANQKKSGLWESDWWTRGSKLFSGYLLFPLSSKTIVWLKLIWVYQVDVLLIKPLSSLLSSFIPQKHRLCLRDESSSIYTWPRGDTKFLFEC